MRIQTFTIVAGSEACNAQCPYCVSRMTPGYELGKRLPDVNWRNFGIGCRFAKDSGVSTVLITGKGEPTLFPDQITGFLKHMTPFAFPFVEIQTNGIALAQRKPVSEKHLREWHELGLTLVALSIVHWRQEKNAEIYQRGAAYYDLAELIGMLHKFGFSIRLSCMMAKGYVDSLQSLKELVAFARENHVEQLTARSIEKPQRSVSAEVASWVAKHAPPRSLVTGLRTHLDKNAARLMELPHGAVIYDWDGQNICLNNCLTIDPRNDTIRQLIFFPDGHLRYDWQYPGAILL